ncbi:MAG: YicC family protein [Alphaproteobacteria bacterium]|nr:YicC family protein [Alphaproteobacteria bacterium]
MISGMTGFARTDGAIEGVRWTWEVRSVNGRGLDVKTRLPTGFEALEQAVREGAQKRFKRGSIQATLAVKQDAAQAAVSINLAQIEAYLAIGERYVSAGRATAPRWDGLLALRGATSAEEGAADDIAGRAAAPLHQTLNAALDALDAARRQEGAMLAAVLGGLTDRIDAGVRDARALAAAQPGAIRERILQRLEALAPDVALDPQRVAQEATVAALRADVQEELERLAAHTQEVRALLASSDAAGRRLDFLAQECAREANTLCAKSQDLALTRIGIDLKTAVDQVKEQAANVE